MRGCVAVCLALGGLALLLGCRPGMQDGPPEKMTVAVSIIPQAWLVEQIGGEHVEAIALVKPGDSCEVYQPTDAQVSRIMAAKVFFRIGMPFEDGHGFRAIESSGKMRIVDTRRGITLRDMAGHVHAPEASGPGASAGSSEKERRAADAEGGKDPHVWLSPRLLSLQARTIAQTLGELDPSHQEDYDRHLRALQQRLGEVDQSIRAKLAPLRGKTFFVFHPAWGYFADEYGLRQVAIETAGKEPSDRELTELQNEARREGVKVIFVQPQTSKRAAEAVAGAIRGRVEILDPLLPDVAANLLHAAESLAESYRGGAPR